MKSNLDFFNLMKQYPEEVIDGYYSHLNGVIIIPQNKDESNALTKATDELYRYIDTFETLCLDFKEKDNTDLIDKILKKIDDILVKVRNINYTSFCQYFMVQNLSHSIYTSLEQEQRYEILKELIKGYIQHRHHLYKAHGYSNVVLQTMSDNYSHKRKGKAGIIKIENQLKEVGIVNRIKTIEDDTLDTFYLLPDKGDKKVFNAILKKHNISFIFSKQKQGKLPDVMIKIKGDYYIVEHKSMKEPGGGQDKQIVEVLDFIRYTEKDSHIHYITYLDGVFSNRFLGHSKAKNEVQYIDIQNILKSNTQNYFVNTATFKLLLKELLNK